MVTGWHVSVFRQADDRYSPADGDAAAGSRLAVWQCGMWGLGWLDELIKDGDVIALGGNGYPTQYTARLHAVIDTIRNGPPDARTVWSAAPGDILGPGWDGRTVLADEIHDSYDHEEWVVIVAWDES